MRVLEENEIPLHTASDLYVLTFLFYLQWKDDVLDGFKVTRRNERLFEVSEVHTIDVRFLCPYKELVPFSPERDRSDTALQLQFPLGRRIKGKQSLLTSKHLLI